MVPKALTGWSRRGLWPVAALCVLLLVSLYLMSVAIQSSQQFGMFYTGLLMVNVLGLAVLVVLIGVNLHGLLRQYRNRVPGSRLAARLAGVFILLAVAPVSVVFYFSLQFLQHGIDSWFDVRLDKTMEDALELSRTALDAKMREYRKRTEVMARQLAGTPEKGAALLLNDLRAHSGASELTLLAQDGHIIASSSANPDTNLPSRPNDAVLFQLRQGLTYVGLDPAGRNNLYVRVALKIAPPTPLNRSRLLQALFPMTTRMNDLADSVQTGYSKYKELAYLRKPLKISFTLTLSLVLLLGLLTAVWAALYSARRLAAPIRALAIGTRAVAAGDYGRQLPRPASSDELGFLVRSFNDMTRRLAAARDTARESRAKVEEHRAYLATVLERLTSGVLSLDKDRVVRTANSAAGQILGVDFADGPGRPLGEIGSAYPHLTPFVSMVEARLGGSGAEWREEVVLFGAGGRQVLMCRGAPLPGSTGPEAGHVIVFDDVTALIRAQRNAAWGEVARRLAHEIKNPLTPIRLSAERLRHRYLKSMDAREAGLLDRATGTIVRQVETLQEMVKAFSEYARPPELRPQTLDLNALVNEVVELYRGDTAAAISTRLDPALPAIQADAGRIRQLLHNLVKNGIEAANTGEPARLSITTRAVRQSDFNVVECAVRDRGPGFQTPVPADVFEPYVTTKPKGTGLGLAIVKRIVEEHGGVVRAENARGGGARIVMRFSAEAEQAPQPPAGGRRWNGQSR